jgi:hypothetical protein
MLKIGSIGIPLFSLKKQELYSFLRIDQRITDKTQIQRMKALWSSQQKNAVLCLRIPELKGDSRKHIITKIKRNVTSLLRKERKYCQQ